MKRLLTAVTIIILTGCTTASTTPLSLPLQERLRNPLLAERYWSGMAEHLADFVRTKDPIIKDSAKAAIIDSERLRALDRVAQARALIDEGMSGKFQTFTLNEDAFGEALLRDNILYFSAAFEIKPNPSVMVFLSSIVDPRDTGFPDATAVSLGQLQTAFGPQSYEIAEGRLSADARTVVLYDTRLERVIGFAQLAR